MLTLLTPLDAERLDRVNAGGTDGAPANRAGADEARRQHRSASQGDVGVGALTPTPPLILTLTLTLTLILTPNPISDRNPTNNPDADP